MSMPDPSVYLEKMSAFSRMLRAEGFSVGPKETGDACAVLSALDLADRERVKTALMTVYAKSREEQIAFARVFDGFFLSEEEMRIQARKQLEEERKIAEAEAKAKERLKEHGGPEDLTEEQIRTYALMPEEARRHLENVLKTYQKSIGREPRLYTSFIHSVFAKTILEQQMKMEDAGIGGLEADPDIGLMFRDISGFKEQEIGKATALIKSISAEINGELSKRKEGKGKGGTLDFRRTIRRGLETGGSFYRLYYKKKRHRRKRLVMLCDVSGSMIQFSEFALRLIKELNNVSESSRVFLFSEELFEANPFHLQNMDRFRATVRESGLYGRGTDLGTALETMLAMKIPVLDQSTTLLILSDTKTVDQPRAIRALNTAKRMAGQVVFLNPIPENKWRYISSARTFSSICAMIPCATLRDLAAACRRITVQHG